MTPWLVSEILIPATVALLAAVGLIELHRVWWAGRNRRPDIVQRSGALAGFFLTAAFYQLWIGAAILHDQPWMVTHPVMAVLLAAAIILLLLYALSCRAFVGAAWWVVPAVAAAFTAAFAWPL